MGAAAQFPVRVAALAGAAAIVLAYRLWPDPWTHAARVALFVSVLARLLLTAGRAVADFLRRRASGVRWTEAAREATPPALRRLLVMEARIYREGLCVVLRRTPPSVRRMRHAPPGRAFTAMRGSFSSVFVPLVVVGCLVDTPLLHLYVHSAAPPASRGLYHALVVAGTLLGLLWAIGDRSAVRHMRHVVAAEVVVLNAGFRRNVSVPVAWIAGADTVSASLRETLRTAVAGRETLLVCHLDAPNVLIALKAPAFDRPLDAARPKARITRIGVYVDQPAAFARACAEAARVG